jgi:hypothetical protein
MSDKAPSADYKRFLASVHGADPTYREELDMDALLKLEGDEKKAAADLLVERVKEEDDWRVPPALAALNLKRAVRPMKSRLGEAKGRMRLALARALVELGALESIEPTVIEMLDEGDPDEGISALAAADDLESADLARALARASVHHKSPEVRINAGAALLYMAKLDDDPLVWKFRPIYLPLGEEDEAVRRAAWKQICDLTELPPSLADEEVPHVSS